jgi:hypothetical protein
MEQMQIFTSEMKMQHIMFLDASDGGTIKTKTNEEVKEFIEQMCHNEYNINNERSTKKVGMIDVDEKTAYLAEIELLKRKLAEKSLLKANASKVQVRCELCCKLSEVESLLQHLQFWLEGSSQSQMGKSRSYSKFSTKQSLSFGRGTYSVYEIDPKQL